MRAVFLIKTYGRPFNLWCLRIKNERGTHPNISDVSPFFYSIILLLSPCFLLDGYDDLKKGCQYEKANSIHPKGDDNFGNRRRIFGNMMQR